MSFNKYIFDITALKENLLAIKRELGNNTKICAVVKADAYGHGVVRVASALSEHVDYFGVANAIEAEQLRNMGITNRVLVLGVVEEGRINQCASNNIEIAITSLDDAISVSKQANLPLKIHIKLNTGMNRYGFSDPGCLKTALELLGQNKNIEIVGAFTHLACKADNHEFTALQFDSFLRLINIINREDLIIHCSNSYNSLFIPKSRLGMVRIGFALYGWQKSRLPLKPVLSIKSKILNIHDVKKGESIGYNRTYFAKKNMRIGLVPMGYADGFDRRLSSRGYVLIRGKKAKVVGMVCMDAFMVDITNIPGVAAGETVTILGEDRGVFLGLGEYAKLLDTSEYEILLKFRYNRMDVIVK